MKLEGCGLSSGREVIKHSMRKIRDVNYCVSLRVLRENVLASSSSSCPLYFNYGRSFKPHNLTLPRVIGISLNNHHFAEHWAPFANSQYHIMSDQFKEILDIPRDFLHDGTQFMNRFALSSSLRTPSTIY